MLFPENVINVMGKMYLNEHNSIINPYIGRCTNAKWRKLVYWRESTVLFISENTYIYNKKYYIYLSTFKKNQQKYIIYL